VPRSTPPPTSMAGSAGACSAPAPVGARACAAREARRQGKTCIYVVDEVLQHAVVPAARAVARAVVVEGACGLYRTEGRGDAPAALLPVCRRRDAQTFLCLHSSSPFSSVRPSVRGRACALRRALHPPPAEQPHCCAAAASPAHAHHTPRPRTARAHAHRDTARSTPHRPWRHATRTLSPATYPPARASAAHTLRLRLRLRLRLHRAHTAAATPAWRHAHSALALPFSMRRRRAPR
jgi:hypothetical protein